MFSSRLSCVFIDCDNLTCLDFWFAYMGSQSKCSQVESVVSSSIVMKEGKRAGVRVGCVCVYVYMYI